MGCDIHIYYEVKPKKTFLRSLIFWKKLQWVSLDKWCLDDGDDDYLDVHPYNRIYTGWRNYNLFAALCGVRAYEFNDPPAPITPPRGIPSDVCDGISFVYKKGIKDYHNANYNSLFELKNYDFTPFGNTCDQFRNEVIPKLEHACRVLNAPETDIRIVYWFDN